MPKQSRRSPVITPLPPAALPWLLLALTLALLPHTLHLLWWLSALFAVAVSWRWLAARRLLRLPHRWLLVVMTITVIAGLVTSHGTLLGRDAGVALLTSMAAMKLLEARSLRDGIVLVFLGFFLLIAQLLFSQTILIAAYLFVAVVFLLSALLLLHHQHQAMTPLASLKFTGLMVLQSIPVMLILFVLFPRVPGPLWTLPENTQSGLSGLSDQMSPGSLDELILSDKVAFRVRFDDTVPASGQLYWRGLVLSRFRDNVWSQRDEVPVQYLPYEETGDRVDYSVMLEPHGRHWLFALDVPARVPPDAIFTRSYQLRREQPVNDRLQYRMSSYLTYRVMEQSAGGRQSYLWLPRDSNPQAFELGRQWRTLPAGERVRNALTMFRQQPFYYTLKPPLLGEHGVDEFLFKTRRGFCEHYASSFAFLMRAAGVPARVVLGYQGGEPNGDYFIVRQSDAHAWTEVWLDESGWVRVDPTAAVAPQRVEQGLYAAVENPDQLPFFARRQNSWVRQMALKLDKLNTAWNEWVLGYNNIRQRQLLEQFGFQNIDWRGMTITMIVALGLLMAAVSAWYVWQRRRVGDPLGRVYQRFCRKLARSGLPRRMHEGPLAFSERVAAARPEMAVQVRRIGRRYAALRYAGSHDGQGLRQLQQWVRRLNSGERS